MRKFLLILLLLVGCSSPKDNTQMSQDVPIKKQLEVECIHQIQTNFKRVCSPVIDDYLIYMAAYDGKSKDLIDARNLVEYNIQTNESKILFESEFDHAIIQGIRINEKWLVFEDMEISGVKDCLWLMNRKTYELKKINAIATEEPSYTIPVLIDDQILWIEEEDLVDGKIIGSIKSYDCYTGEVDIIAKMNDISTGNIYLEWNKDRILWCDSVNGEMYYYIYDTKTKETMSIEAHLNAVMNPILVNEYIVSMEAIRGVGNYKPYIYNTKTKQSKENDIDLGGYYAFGDYVLWNNGLTAFLSSIDDDLDLNNELGFTKNMGEDYTITNNQYVIFERNTDSGMELFVYSLK